VINDLNTGKSDSGPSFWFGGSGTSPYGDGNVCFTSVSEPSLMALMLLGFGLLFVARKLAGQSIPQAS
jgi:hypothetical protein